MTQSTGNRFVAALILVAALLRIALLWDGGQRFSPDETRYDDSLAGAAQIVEGNWRAGMAEVLKTGEHPGFKLFGLIPATAELTFGRNSYFPTIFFGSFSFFNVLLIALIARRSGMTPEAQVWAALTMVCSVAMFFYSRHLYPYDLSITLALLGLLTGLRAPSARWQFIIAGLLCGLAFVTYLAYWLFAGTVMVLIVLRHARSLPAFIFTSALTTLGFLAALSALWSVDQLGAGNLLIKIRTFSGMIGDDSFGNGFILPWQYLISAEGLAVAIYVASAAIAFVRILKFPDDRAWRTPTCLFATGLLVLYAMMVIGSELAHMVVITGRVARLLVPLLALICGSSIAYVVAATNHGRAARILIGLLLAGSAVLPFTNVLRQEFPTEFRQRGMQLLASLPAAPAGSYYRFVNVDSFFHEAEALSAPPEETLLASRHPYQFAPYIYEGFSPPERRHRLQMDHRMRLVRVKVPSSAIVQGEDFGMIRAKLRFPTKVPSDVQPLISVGSVSNGELLSVRYAQNNQIVLVLESMGVTVLVSELINYTPGAIHEIELFTGSLLPPEGQGNLTTHDRLHLQNMGLVRMDGVDVLNAVLPAHAVRPDQLYLGFNYVEATSAATAFAGEIIDVRRGGYPPVPPPIIEYGAIRFAVRLPANTGGLAEPLATTGMPGDAFLCYVRMLTEGQLQVGMEIWGIGVHESPSMPIASDAPVEIVVSAPAFFPPAGADSWGELSTERQTELLSNLTISVNGVVVIHVPVSPKQPSVRTTSFGKNHVGGSWVGRSFGGDILSIERLPY